MTTKSDHKYLIESDERTNLSVERGEAEGNMGAGEDRRPLKGRNRGRARAAYLPPATPQPLLAPLPTALLSLHVITIIIIHAFHADTEFGFESCSTRIVTVLFTIYHVKSHLCGIRNPPPFHRQPSLAFGIFFSDEIGEEISIYACFFVKEQSQNL